MEPSLGLFHDPKNRINISLLASVSINLNTGTKQTLFTVPTGRKCMVTLLVERSASAAITAAIGGFGFDANATNVKTGWNFTDLTSSAIAGNIRPLIITVGSAGDVLGYKATTPEATSKTVVIDVFGYLF